MNIIIAGAGKVGGTLTKILTAEGHDVTVIDRDLQVVNDISNKADVACVLGSATNPESLSEAGAKEADIIIAATEVDEINMVCGMAAKGLGTKHVIARIRDTEYLTQREFFQNTLGLSFIINPEYESAKEISRTLRFPGAQRVDEFSKSQAELIEYRVRADSRCKGIPLLQLSQVFKAKVLAGAVVRGNEAIIPNGDFVLCEGDVVTFVGSAKELRKLFIAMGEYKKPVKNAVIMGGGRIAVYLTALLEETGIEVTIIENDPERCKALTDLAPDAKIIYGDARKNEVLSEEGVGTADAFVALTGNDADNIITSIYASKCGVDKIVTKVDSEHYTDILDLDTTITPKTVIAQQIARYVRALNNSQASSSIETLYRLANGKAEALEFKVAENSRCAGIPLKELKLKPNVLVAAIIRRNKTVLPDGATEILPGDHAIIVTTPGWLTELDNIAEEADA